MLAPPSCSMSSARWLAWAAATAARLASTRSLASVESPAISKLTSAACPSAETSLSPDSGDLMCSTYFTRARRLVTSVTAARNSGSLSVSESLWTNTTSLTGRRPERSSACSALCDSPENWSTSEMFVVPTTLPIPNTATTNASQPQKAFLRCRLLQTAMRAARLWFADGVDIAAPDGTGGRRRHGHQAPAEGWSRNVIADHDLRPRETRSYTCWRAPT